MSAFDAALGTLLNDSNLGVDIVYTPQTGPSVSCRAAFSQPDVDFSALSVKTRAHSRCLRVRASDVAHPRNGESIAIGTARYTIIETVQRDPLRLMHDLTLAPA